MKQEYIIYVIACLDFVGISMLLPLMHKHLASFGATPSFIGLSSSVYGFIQLFSSPLAGSWADQIGMKRSLFFTLLAAGSGFLLIGGASSLAVIVIARIWIGLFKHTQTLCKAYLSQSHHSRNSFGFLNAISSIGFIIGPPIGAHLAEGSEGVTRVALVAGYIFIFNAGLVYIFLDDIDTKRREATPEPKSAFFLSLKKVAWSEYGHLFLLKFFLMMGPMLYRTNASAILSQSMEMSTVTIGYLISFQGLVTTLAGFGLGLLLPYYGQRTQTMLKHFAVLQMISFLVLIQSRNIWGVLIGLFLLSVSNVVCRVTVTQLIVDITVDKRLGSVLGVAQSVSSVVRVAAPISAGLMQEGSPSGPTFGAVASSLIASLVLLRMRKEIKITG